MAHATVTAEITKLDLTFNAVVFFSAEYSINHCVLWVQLYLGQGKAAFFGQDGASRLETSDLKTLTSYIFVQAATCKDISSLFSHGK